MAVRISPGATRKLLCASEEVAFLDVREAGQFGLGHPLLAVPLPYSRLELRIGLLVPRKTTPLVLIDGGDGVADLSAKRLEAMGYDHLAVVEGGTPAWAAAGYDLFEGVNVPSKGFGEFVEHSYGTPSIAAEDVKAKMERGEKVVILDSRPAEEYRRMNVPGATSCPGVELIARAPSLVTDSETLVVINCAGRTRGIIGAQALISAGLPNRVSALRNGTQGWVLAGFELTHGSKPELPKITERGREFAKAAAARLATRYRIPTISKALLHEWQDDVSRTCFLLDVRTREEFLDGHLPGAVHAPGGQLVQATDEWLGTRGARVVLYDDGEKDGGARAVITAHWLAQMGWDQVYVLDSPLEGCLEQGETAFGIALPPGVTQVNPTELAARLRHDATRLIDVGSSRSFREGHIAGSLWVPRPRLQPHLEQEDSAREIVLVSEDGELAALAARDALEGLKGPIAILTGGRAAWRAEGRPLRKSPDTPTDGECIDVLFWAHERHSGNRDHMHTYLTWEQGLPERIAADGLIRYADTSEGGGEKDPIPN